MRHIQKPFVIAMIGPVGSGKSHTARILASKLGAAHLCTDDVRVQLRRRGQPIHRAIAIIERRAEALLKKGKPLVLDSDFVNPAKRRHLKKQVSQFGAKPYFVEVAAPEAVILARLRRKRYTSRDLFRSAGEAIRVYYMRKKFRGKLMRSRKIFSPDFTIDNSKPLGPQIGKIAEEIGEYEDRS